MYTLLDRLGGYLPPGVLGPIDLTSLISRLLQQDGAPLVDVRLVRDPASARRTVGVVLIDAPEETRPDQPLLDGLLSGFLPQGMSSSEKAKEIQTISNFISTLEKNHPKDSTSGIVSNPVAYNVSRLQMLYPFVKWCALFDEVLGWNCTDGSGEEDIAYVTSGAYLTGLNAIIDRFPKRVVHNSILMLYARDRLRSLLNYTSHNQRAYCSELTATLFRKPVGNLYVRQYPADYVERLENRANRLFGRLKNTLAGRMGAALWLDAESQQAVLEKLDKVNAKFFTRLTASDDDPLQQVSVQSGTGTVVGIFSFVSRMFYGWQCNVNPGGAIQNKYNLYATL